MPQPDYLPNCWFSGILLIHNPDMSSGILPCGLTTRRRDKSTAGRNWRKLWNGLSTRSSSHARIPHISRSLHRDEDRSGHLRLVGQGVQPSISRIIFYLVVLIRHETTQKSLIRLVCFFKHWVSPLVSLFMIFAAVIFHFYQCDWGTCQSRLLYASTHRWGMREEKAKFHFLG